MLLSSLYALGHYVQNVDFVIISTTICLCIQAIVPIDLRRDAYYSPSTVLIITHPLFECSDQPN